MYRIHAASLFDTNSNMFPPSHLGDPRGKNNHVVQEENEQLRKENAELKKRIEQLTKNKKHL
jgi:hypothetical protein